LSLPAKPKILVVDDQPINVKLLQRKLERQNMDVYVAYNGRECLDQVAALQPDLILLDIMMPEMDGIETCQQIKADAATEAIPIIFITANASKKGKLEGLEAGAVDYITKPIDLEETLARVRTQLRLKEIYRENVGLQARLGDARKAAAVGAITQGIAHNLNNLLGVVVGYLDLIKNGYDSPDMVQRSVGSMDHAVTRMVGIIRQLSSIAGNKQFEMSTLPIADLVESSIERFEAEQPTPANITVRSELESDAKISANAEIFETILVRLLANALESYPEASHEADRSIHVNVSTESADPHTHLQIKVTDHGSGIDASVKDSLFEPFITTKSAVGRGMGLTIARHTMRNLGGDVHLQENADGGVTAIMTHPLQQN
jgi:CheY-like chemotaxis protein